MGFFHSRISTRVAEATGAVTVLLLSNPFTGTALWVLSVLSVLSIKPSSSQPLRGPELWQLVLAWHKKAEDMMVHWH